MLSFTQKLLLLILLFLLLCIINFGYKTIKYKSLTIDQALKMPDNYIKYMQKYKIKNFTFTVFSTFVYFFSQISLMFYLRLSALEKANIYVPINIENIIYNKDHLYSAIGTILLVLITFICFKLMLNQLFFGEVHKLYYYLLTKPVYFNIEKFLTTEYLAPFWGKFYLFFHNVSNLRTYSDMDDYQEFYLYNTIYENTKIQTLSLQCVNFATKSRIIRWFFKFLRWVFKLLYRHMHDNGFIFYIPIYFYVIAIFYDFLNMKIYYTYYLFFPLYFIILLRQYLKFLNQKSPYIDNKLSQYYYSTDAVGKTYVSTKVTGSLHLRFNIFDESVISYVLNNLYKKNSLENYNLNKKGEALYRRVFFIIICFILSIYLIKKNIYSVVIIFLNLQLSVSLLLSLLFIILVYASLNTFRFPENNLNYCYPYFVYKRSYWLLFWATLIIHFIIYIFFIVKPHLFIINKEVIAEYFGIQFVQYFTIEDKNEK